MVPTADDLDPSATWEVATQGRRLAGFLLDLLVLNVLASTLLQLGRVVGWVIPPPAEPPSTEYLVQLLLFCYALQVSYYFLFEALSYRTPGKMVCQTRVMHLDGADPSLGTALARTLVRLVPFEPLSFMGALNTGWHDRWTNTCVVRRVDHLGERQGADDESGY